MTAVCCERVAERDCVTGSDSDIGDGCDGWEDNAEEEKDGNGNDL